MTVLDHMKAAGYDPNAARNADDLRRRAAVPHGSQLDGRPGRSRYRADEPEDVPPVAEARRLLRVHLKGEASSWRTTLLKPFFHRRKHSTSS